MPRGDCTEAQFNQQLARILPLAHADNLSVAIRSFQSQVSLTVWVTQILAGRDILSSSGFFAVWTCSPTEPCRSVQMARRIAVILAGDFVAGNAPLILLSSDKVGNNPPYQYWTCALIVMGFMANRVNVSITGLQASAEIYYVPKWSEFAPTVMVITCALLAFPYAVIYLDVLVKNPSQSRWMMKGAVTEV
jgi:hypothetical protein